MYAGLLIPAIAVSFMLISAVVDLVGGARRIGAPKTCCAASCRRRSSISSIAAGT
jgi:hypothetical protein